MIFLLRKTKGIHFFFARQVDGKLVIGPDEKKVEFHCRSPKPIKVTFDLHKMTRNGKPDL